MLARAGIRVHGRCNATQRPTLVVGRPHCAVVSLRLASLGCMPASYGGIRTRAPFTTMLKAAHRGMRTRGPLL